MDIPQIILTTAVGLGATIITAVVTHFLTRAQERRKHEREVSAKVAAMKSTERDHTKVMAVQYGHSCFVIVGPEETERDRVFLPTGSRITMGSAPDNHIRLTDQRVSKMHAAFRAQGNAAYVEPLGAVNGLAVNGNVISDPCKLTVGDVITIPGAPYSITFVPLVI